MNVSNRIIRSFHRLGVAVFVLLAGGSWAITAALFSRGVGDSAIIGIGAVATVVVALAAGGFYCVVGWVWLDSCGTETCGHCRISHQAVRVGEAEECRLSAGLDVSLRAVRSALVECTGVN